MILLFVFMVTCVLGTIEIVAKSESMIEAREKAQKAFRG